MVLADDESLVAQLRQRLTALDEEHRRLTAEIDDLSGQRERLEESAEHIRALIGGAELEGLPQPQEPGQSIPDIVVELLRETGHPMHYREIADALLRRGVPGGDGKDPANILLARYYNDERLFRPARGTYALKTGRTAKSVGSRTVKKRKNARHS